MRHVRDYGPFDPIYIFVGDDGEQVCLDTDALYHWVQDSDLTVYAVPVNSKLAVEMIHQQSIQLERIDEMLVEGVADPSKYRDPIIMVKTGGSNEAGAPDVLLCDGHHRYFVACLAKRPVIDAYVLEPEQWEPYRIHGVPPTTQEKVRNMLPRAPRSQTERQDR